MPEFIPVHTPIPHPPPKRKARKGKIYSEEVIAKIALRCIKNKLLKSEQIHTQHDLNEALDKSKRLVAKLFSPYKPELGAD